MTTGLAIRPAAFGKGEASHVRHRFLGSHPFGRPLIDAAATRRTEKRHLRGGPGASRVLAFKVSRSHPIPAVRRDVPEPVTGLMEIPAVERRPFPVPCVGQMETFIR